MEWCNRAADRNREIQITQIIIIYNESGANDWVSGDDDNGNMIFSAAAATAAALVPLSHRCCDSNDEIKKRRKKNPTTGRANILPLKMSKYCKSKISN